MNFVATRNEAEARSDDTTLDVKIGRKPQVVPDVGPEIPDYLQDTYYWCYISPKNVPKLDRDLVVRTILWQQHKKLQQVAFEEIEEGMHAYQPASVYGDFAANLAGKVGPTGSLLVTDVAPIQVRRCTEKLAHIPQATVRHANAIYPTGDQYDVICCYFLMHEVPEDYKRGITDTMLASLKPGGKLIYVDYHKPHWAHPLKLITSIVFDTLEPFAKSLWHHEISEFATESDRYTWRKSTYFGGLFQRVIVERKD